MENAWLKMVKLIPLIIFTRRKIYFRQRTPFTKFIFTFLGLGLRYSSVLFFNINLSKYNEEHLFIQNPHIILKRMLYHLQIIKDIATIF